MSHLNPNKLHVKFKQGITPQEPLTPRAYTLTHSDSTGDLFLTIAQQYNIPQISGWYTRLMRDEVLAQWESEANLPSLHVHCHVSGGLLFGTANWRESIFRRHMPMVLEAFRYGDRKLFETHPEMDHAKIWVHFHRARSHQDKVESWGQAKDYRINSLHTANIERTVD